ncbi:MAG: ubiquinol-cytochrome c reductase iron-sulfur subunit, partial [Candidatus Zixiibacteriota bacterium]
SLMPSNWTPRSYIYRKIYATSLKDINVIGKAILFQDKANHRKAILVNNDGVIQAFSLVCSHLGCQVSWDKENREFFCPCHRGKFFSDGRVKSGPPPKGLDEYNVNIEGDMVFIEFKEPYWQPEQYFKGGYKL